MFKVLQGTVAESVAIMLNVSLNTEISDDMLVYLFQAGKVPREWVEHLHRFYGELHIDVIKAFVAENSISKSVFFQIHSQLPAYCRNSNFISLLNRVYP